MVDPIGTSALSSIDLGPTNSIQLIFAQLQLKLSEECKTKAMDMIEEIQNSQELSKQVAAYIQEAQANKDSATSSKDAVPMSKDMNDFFDEHELGKKNATTEGTAIVIKFPPILENMISDKKKAEINAANEALALSCSAEQWEYNITSLKNYQEQLGVDTQQKMVLIQDYMGQYNSYLQGASSSISQSNQTLTNIARGQ